MQKNQSNRLWAVGYTSLTHSYHDQQRLWILADSVEVASRKAVRVLRKDGHKNIAIHDVSSHGTIDAF